MSVNREELRRDMNFTAVKVDTMTGNPLSLCSIALVKVVKGMITQKFYTLIKPIPTEGKTNTGVNGVTEEMVADAPDFKEVWPLISSFIQDQTIVSHSSNSIVETVLDCMGSYYGIDIDYRLNFNTYNYDGVGIIAACEKEGIVIADEDDPLCIASAIAEYRLKLYGFAVPQRRDYYDFRKMMKNMKSGHKRLSGDTIKPLDDDEVENKDTPFFKKKVVITGVFNAYPDREELAQMLKKYGADINQSISRKTNIVIVGRDAGPSKLKKIVEINEKGENIETWAEDKLLEVVKKYGIK